MGDFVEAEIVATKTNASREPFKPGQLVQHSVEDCTSKIGSIKPSNESCYSICKDILVDLIDDTFDAMNIVEVPDINESTYRAEEDEIEFEGWKLNQNVTRLN